MSKIEIKNSKKYGRGLYATKTIKRGEVIEMSPIIEVESWQVRDNKLNVYVFEWKGNKSALALGNGSLFNHSKKRPNVTYNPAYQSKTIIFVALRDIKRGHQLFIDYGYDPKYGVEVTERNLLGALRNKYEGPRGYDMLDNEKPMLDEARRETK